MALNLKLYFSNMYHTFLFDLDNTIYPESSGIMSGIRDRIILYMKTRLGLDDDSVTTVRQYCLDKFGTTLQGLKHLYGIDGEEYLSFVHDINLPDFIKPDRLFRQFLDQYPQRKVIFSNADIHHINHVLDYLNIKDFFNGIIDVHTLDPFVKPQKESFEIAREFLQLTNWEGCVFIDDHIPNIQTATELGIFSILVDENRNHDYPFRISELYDLPTIIPPMKFEVNNDKF